MNVACIRIVKISFAFLWFFLPFFSEQHFWIIPTLSTRPRFLSPSFCFQLPIKARAFLCLSSSIFYWTITMFFPQVSSILTIHLHNPSNSPRKAREETTSFTLPWLGINDSTTFFKQCIMSKATTGNSLSPTKIQPNFPSTIEEHNTYFIRFKANFSIKGRLFYFYSKNRLSSIFPQKILESPECTKLFNFLGQD